MFVTVDLYSALIVLYQVTSPIINQSHFYEDEENEQKIPLAYTVHVL